MPPIELVPDETSIELWWNSYQSAEPEFGWRELYDVIVANLPLPAYGEVGVRTLPERKASMALTGRDDGYLVGNSVHDCPEPFLHNDITMFAPALQRRGHGTTVITNMVRAASALGLSELKLKACERGPYAWTMMGFLPTSDAWPEVQNRLRHFIALMEGELDSETVELLHAIADDDDPEAIRDLRQLDEVIEGCPIAAFNGLTPMAAFLTETGLGFDAVLDMRVLQSWDIFCDYCYGEQ